MTGYLALACGLLLAEGFAAAPVASAQNNLNRAGVPNQNNIVIRGRGGYGGYGGFGMPYGGFGGAGLGWGSPGTAQSAGLQGLASVIGASGYANLMDSQAVINLTQARSQDIKNRVEWTNSYIEMRQAHKAYVASNITRLSTDELNKIAKDQSPRRLDVTQLDPITGRITWPIILRDPRYAEPIDDLENLFKTRATTSGFIGAESYLGIDKACDKLMDLLKSNIDEYNSRDYIGASRFLESLRFDARSPST
ncbi:MAG TPA: hypothetical protein VGJ26_08210 [Pirellulales bacterium]